MVSNIIAPQDLFKDMIRLEVNSQGVMNFLTSLITKIDQQQQQILALQARIEALEE